MPEKETTPLKQKIYTWLRDQIVLGQLGPGQHVKEATLTDRFNCSRGPVREAFNRLEKGGYLELNPNQGAVVKRTSAQEVLDYYALLELLEAETVRLAVPRMSPDDFAELERLNDDIRSLTRKGGEIFEAWVPLNFQFHQRFRTCCGNSRMDWIIEEVRMRTTRYRYTSLLVAAYDDYVEDHQHIIDASRKRDASAAAQAMRAHVGRAKQVLMDFLSKFPEF